MKFRSDQKISGAIALLTLKIGSEKCVYTLKYLRKVIVTLLVAHYSRLEKYLLRAKKRVKVIKIQLKNILQHIEVYCNNKFTIVDSTSKNIDRQNEMNNAQTH